MPLAAHSYGVVVLTLLVDFDNIFQILSSIVAAYFPFPLNYHLVSREFLVWKQFENLPPKSVNFTPHLAACMFIHTVQYVM